MYRLPRRDCLASLGRIGLWLVVLGLTALLVRAEPRRPERPDGVRVGQDLVYRKVAGHRLAVDVYQPESAPPVKGWPAVLALHGGGWRGGGKGDFGRQMAPLSQHELVVIAVDYRLSRPGHPSWPDNLDDVREAIRWVRRHAGELKIDPERIALLGASAGGHLAALAGMRSDDPEARVEAVIDLYGPSDLLALTGAAADRGGPVDLLLGGPATVHPDEAVAASPARRVTPDSAPMLLIHGRDDRLIPLDQSRLLAEALSRAGVPHRLIILDQAAHGFGLQVGAVDLIPEILVFLQGVWNDNSR